MKAINYKGHNKFYLFDKPEEPRKKDFQLEDDAYIDPIYYDALDYYEQQLESNLSSGKEIINPEVLPDLYKDDSGVWFSTGWNNETGVHDLKPGDIFDLPDNIGFEELPAKICRLLSKGNDHLKIPTHGVVVRLFLKEESDPFEDICKNNPNVSRVESDVDKLLKQREELEHKIRQIDSMALINYELGKLGLNQYSETQYELWDDAINTYNCLDVEFEREAINYLKSKFTITRNQ